MNLQEFSSPLPKPWLDINCDEFEARTANVGQLSTIGHLANGSYDPNIAVTGPFANVTLANFAQYIRIGNQVFLSGSFLADTAAVASSGSIEFDLPPGVHNVLANHRAGFFNGTKAQAGVKPLVCVDVANSTSTRVIMSVISIDNTACLAVTGIRFSYSLAVEALPDP